MNIIQLYQDHGVHYMTEGHKHCHPGWVHTACPLCAGNPGMHLGYNLESNVFVCWRCGIHSKVEVVSALLNLSPSGAFELLKKYERSRAKIPEPKINIHKKRFKLPPNEPLLLPHKNYLKNRGFDARFLETEWDLTGTGIYSKLGNLDFSRRIIIPIHWQGQMVSFQARDITGMHPLKYIACPEEREIINLKTILYLHPEFEGDMGICVEGVTDVWNVGRSGFATFGIKYTPLQVKMIRKHFKQVVIFFDNEEQAQVQARALEAELNFFSVKTDLIVPPKGLDPGSMPHSEIEKLLNL